MSPAFINRLILLFWKLKKNDDLKVTLRTLIDKYQMDQHDAKKLWVFGPE
mgnify:CR=1 FL=1